MGDDPFSLVDLPEDKDDKACCLEGIHPDKYNGEHVQTTRFLNMFNQFMLMNYKADIVLHSWACTIIFYFSLPPLSCHLTPLSHDHRTAISFLPFLSPDLPLSHDYRTAIPPDSYLGHQCAVIPLFPFLV